MADVRIDMVAREAFELAGEQYAAGECFSCSPIVAAALRYKHKAEFTGLAKRRDEEDRRRYLRRDMVAGR